VIIPSSKAFILSPLTPKPGFFWNFLHEFRNFYDMGLDNAMYKEYEQFSIYPEIYFTSMLPTLTGDIIDFLITFNETRMPNQQVSGANCYIQGMVMGGQISRVASNTTAFPWRDRLICAADAMCNFRNAKQQIESERFIAGYYDGTQKWSKGIYLNFPQPGVPNFAKLYRAYNLAQLSVVTILSVSHKRYRY
jgi:hypothetical protein